jgi:Large eukaryotic DNA virus major capsid protein/Major capsid protein N-terminus
MAGRASLSFLGQEDIYLSSDPEVTYFVEKYVGQTLFSSRVIRVQFPGDNTVTFGSDRRVLIPRAGDLITNMYLKIIPPALPVGVQVLDSVATLMIQYVDLYIGSELIERLYGEYLELRFDLSVPQGKQRALTNLIGKNLVQPPQTPLFINATYTVPLPFYVFRRGLPLCAFNEDVTFRITWNPSTLFTTPPVNVTTPFYAYIDTEYTYISNQEIEYIKSKPHTYPVEQVQREEFFAPQGTNKIQCFGEFLNPVKQFYFVFQNDSAFGYDYTTNNSYTANGTTYEQLSQLVLDFNTIERISKDIGSPVFLRVIQPLEYHTRIPDRIFYMYSFSLDPELYDEPTGAVNMSQIKNQIFQFTLNPSQANRYIRIYGINYNFMYISNSSAKMIFSNFH